MAHILLIEPDRLLAANISEYLQFKGHRISWRSDAQAAINSSEENAPELVILELQLGSHSGLDFIYEFRSYSDWQSIPIIVFSNLPSSEIASNSTYLDQLEIVNYHFKPQTSLERLGQSVDQALELSRHR